MTLLVVGFILGALVAGGAVWLYTRHHTEVLRHEHHLLRGRLRSFVALMDSGLLTSDDPQVRTMLLETGERVTDGGGAQRPAATPVPAPQSPGEDDDLEDGLPGIFKRRRERSAEGTAPDEERPERKEG